MESEPSRPFNRRQTLPSAFDRTRPDEGSSTPFWLVRWILIWLVRWIVCRGGDALFLLGIFGGGGFWIGDWGWRCISIILATVQSHISCPLLLLLQCYFQVRYLRLRGHLGLLGNLHIHCRGGKCCRNSVIVFYRNEISYSYTLQHYGQV